MGGVKHNILNKLLDNSPQNLEVVRTSLSRAKEGEAEAV